jgi:hypothetical protein
MKNLTGVEIFYLLIGISLLALYALLVAIFIIGGIKVLIILINL